MLDSDPDFTQRYLELIDEWCKKIIPHERVFPRVYARFVLRWVSDPLFGTEVLGLGKLKAILHEKDLPDDYLKELLEDTLPTMFSDFKPITRKDGRKDTSTARRIKTVPVGIFSIRMQYIHHTRTTK